jgi:hypothetical protein
MNHAVAYMGPDGTVHCDCGTVWTAQGYLEHVPVLREAYEVGWQAAITRIESVAHRLARELSGSVSGRESLLKGFLAGLRSGWKR